MKEFLLLCLAAALGELWMWFWKEKEIKNLKEEITELKSKQDERN